MSKSIGNTDPVLELQSYSSRDNPGYIIYQYINKQKGCEWLKDRWNQTGQEYSYIEFLS
jgi:hypothetical protein